MKVRVKGGKVYVPDFIRWAYRVNNWKIKLYPRYLKLRYDQKILETIYVIWYAYPLEKLKRACLWIWYRIALVFYRLGVLSKGTGESINLKWYKDLDWKNRKESDVYRYKHEEV